VSDAACLILLDGELGDPAEVRRAARRCKGVLCADGGLRHARKLKIEPDFVVGDMDSLPHPLPRWKKTVYWCDFDEQRSDFEKALELAAGLGCARAYVAGAWGGRLDHCLVNAALAAQPRAELEVLLVGRGTAVCLGPGRHQVPLPAGRRFSLLALPQARVTLSGARYGLKDETLVQGSRGLGNEALGPIGLEIREGRVWLFVDPARAPRVH